MDWLVRKLRLGFNCVNSESIVSKNSCYEQQVPVEATGGDPVVVIVVVVVVVVVVCGVSRTSVHIA